MPILPGIPQSELYSYSPKVHYGETQLPLIMERFALRAERGRKARREAETLRKLGIEVPGLPEARPEPTSMLGGVMRGIKDIAMPAEGMTDLQRAIAEAGIKQKYAEPKKYEPTTREEALGFEREKAELTAGTEKYKTATVLRKEFNTAKVMKDYTEIERAAKGIRQAHKMSVSPDAKSRIASDQALGVLFQKMLDPASVVRESEYARTPEGAATLNRIRAKVPQMMKGGLALADEDRTALMEMAEKLLDSAKVTLNTHIGRYQSLSKDYNVPWKLIGGGIKQFPTAIDLRRPTTPGAKNTVTFSALGENLEIPVNEVEEFKRQFPTAIER